MWGRPGKPIRAYGDVHPVLLKCVAGRWGQRRVRRQTRPAYEIDHASASLQINAPHAPVLLIGRLSLPHEAGHEARGTWISGFGGAECTADCGAAGIAGSTVGLAGVGTGDVRARRTIYSARG